MSRDHGIPNNNNWGGYDPNTYPAQDPSIQYGNNYMMQNGALQQYQIAGNMNQGQAGYWDPNAQVQYQMPPTNYTPNNYYAPSPIQPQYYQPPTPQPVQQYYPADSNMVQQHVQSPSNTTPNQSAQLAHKRPVVPPLDYPLLMISLAEEYFDAAHELAPSIAISMTGDNLHEYHKLITMGLECLSIALKTLKLPPRLEAKVRLRFAGVVFEETNDYADAEILLSQGILLCEQNHYYDLKYTMQFLLARLMFEKNPKASMRLLDGQISDAQAYQHYSWVYVFRFLRASHALELGTSTDSNAAIQNIRTIASLSYQQNDRSVYIIASLMEAVACLKSEGVHSIEQVQRAIAATRQYQCDNGSSMPQLVSLAHILDVICSILRGDSDQMLKTLKRMQGAMDQFVTHPGWNTEDDTLRVPIDNIQKVKHMISQDTRMVLGIGEDGRGELIMSFLNKRDAFSISYFLSAIVLLHKYSMDGKALRYLKQGLSGIDDDARKRKLSPGACLSDLIAKQQWRGQMLCYLHVYVAFCAAIVSDWPRVKDSMKAMTTTAERFEVSLPRCLQRLVLYLDGVYHQGTGDLETALEIFSDEAFQLTGIAHSTSEEQVERDITLLASLNSLLILQHPQWQDSERNFTLISDLEPYCNDHPNKEIQTAFSLIRATTRTGSSATNVETKNHLAAALHKAKVTGNAQFLCLVLNIMCSKFFSNCLGEQAEKSAKAARKQAETARSKLWMSVSGGLNAQFHDISENRPKAQAALTEACILAHEALPGR